MPSSDQEVYHQGQQLEAYLEQSFLTTVAFTNTPVVYKPLQEMLKDVQQLLKKE